MSDTHRRVTRATARASTLGSINEELPVPVPDLKRTYSQASQASQDSQDSDYSFLTAEEATAYRKKLSRGSSGIGQAFGEGVDHIDQIQEQLVEALIKAYVSHKKAGEAWLGTDIEVLREKHFELNDAKSFLKEEFNKVYDILDKHKGALLIILNDINRQLNGVTDINTDGTLNSTQIESVISNVVNTHIPNTYMVTTAAKIPRLIGGKKNKTHRKKRTHRKKHRTHRKKRTHRKTRKN
jgi:hypothetical protein